VEKYGRAREAVHDNTAHATGMLDTRATHTHTISNNYCFSTATVVRQKRLNVTSIHNRKMPVSLTTYVNLYCLLSFLDTEKRTEHKE
jgi:hypothetical protein